MQNPKHLAIRRIAVALDCSPHSQASLAAAVELAARLRAALVGIFVEDINVIRLAEHPGTSEIRMFQQEADKIEPESLMRAMRRQAEQAKRELEESAARHSLTPEFRISRGLVPGEVLAAAVGADLLVLGRSGRSPSCRKRLGSTALAAAQEAPMARLLMKPGYEPGELPVMALIDSSSSTTATLQAALALLPDGQPLHLFLLAASPGEAEALQARIEQEPALRQVEYHCHYLPPQPPEALARYIRLIDSGLLVLNTAMALTPETLLGLLNHLDTPVMLL